MLVRALGASAFGLRIRGGIPMVAAQTNVYHDHAPASRAAAGITRSIRIPITHSLAKKRGVPMPPSKGLAVRICMHSAYKG